ncbi:DUF1460 domain-containing protein, partial [bacterium]|nr:DUF1460 domain-containing protein [bacterium]
GKSKANNITNVSSVFLGIPYFRDPLGENGGIDKDPIYRFDRFDCLTFVETVLALTFSKNSDDFEDIIKRIRYSNGEVDIKKRNHFINPDWIQNNSDFVKEATKDIADKINSEISVSKIMLDRKTWFKKNYNIDINIEEQEAVLDYITLDTLLAKEAELKKAITEPMIVNIVIYKPSFRKRYGSEINTSHIGFIIPSENELIFRHASFFKEKVVDDEFFRYLRMLKKYKMYKGINFLEIKS